MSTHNIEIIYSKRRTFALEIKPDGKVIVRTPLRTSKRKISAFVDEKSEWIEKHLKRLEASQKAMNAVDKLTNEELQMLKEKALQYIPQRVKHYSELIGVEYGKITIRCQKTTWGSCSAKGNLNFNCLLMLASPEVIDSVIVHELCHIKEMNHSAKFYAEVIGAYPEYKKWNKWLKENGPAIMSRAI